MIFATPEYNSSVPGALKNALDWASRPLATNAFRNKPVGVIGVQRRRLRRRLGRSRAAQGARRDGRARHRRRARRRSRPREVRRERRARRRRRSPGPARRSLDSSRRGHTQSRRRVASAQAASSGGSSSASRRCTTARASTPTSLPALDDRDPLEVVLLDERERIGERHRRLDRRVRRLGDRRRARSRLGIEARGDDLAHERLSRHDADEATAVVADEHRPDLRPRERLTRLAGALLRTQGERIGHHRIADEIHRRSLERPSARDDPRTHRPAG